MTDCMTHGCEEEAEMRMKTEGFFYDDFRCREHSGPDHKPVEEFA